MKKAIQLGIILSIISLVSTLCIESFLSIDFLFSWKTIGLSLLISLLALILLGRLMLRNEDNPSLSYGEALKYLFVASIVSGIIGQVVMIARHSQNEEMKEAFTDYAINSQLTGVRMGMQMAGADESTIEDNIEEMKIAIDNGESQLPDYPFTLANLPLNILNSSFMSLILSLIGAIFVKYKGSDFT